MAATATFAPAAGLLAPAGDPLDTAVTPARDAAAGKLPVDSGAVVALGGTPRMANAPAIHAFGQSGGGVLTGTQSLGRWRW